MSAFSKHLKFIKKLQQYTEQEPIIRSKDIEMFINQAIDTWVDLTYKNFNGKEDLRKRLEPLIITKTIDRGSIGVGPRVGPRGGELWPFPTGSQIRYIYSELVQFNNSTALIPVKPVPVTYFNKQQSNPFKKPYRNLVWRTEGDLSNGLVELIVDNAVIAKYIITYIKHPQHVNLHSNLQVDTDIDMAWEDEIIDIAVNIALNSYKLLGAFTPKPVAQPVQQQEQPRQE